MAQRYVIFVKFWCFSTFVPDWQGNRYRIVLKRSEMNSTHVLYPGGVLSSKSTKSGDRNLGNRPKIANFRSRGTFWPWLTGKSLPYSPETFRNEFYAYSLPRRCIIVEVYPVGRKKTGKLAKNCEFSVPGHFLALIDKEIDTVSFWNFQIWILRILFTPEVRYL